MKKIILTYIILFSSAIYGQNRISFEETSEGKTDLSSIFRNYKILKISEKIDTIGEEKKLTLSYKAEYIFKLKENRLFSADYSAIIKKENGIEYKKLDELGFDGRYFLNADRSKNHQLALSIFENQYSFYVKSQGKQFYIEPLRKFDKTATIDNYVYYEVKDVIENPAETCGVKSQNTPDFHFERNQMQQPNLGCKILEMNFCVDYSFYTAANYSINNTINKTFEIMNLCQLDYTIANGLAYDVNFKLKRHYIITCTDCNYWPTTVDLTTNHYAFILYENYTQIFDTKADVKVFWESSTLVQPAFGYGTQGVLTYCDPNWTITTRGTASVRLSGSTNYARLVLSHELGHNFGCQHIQDDNNIMSSGVYAGNNWDPISIDIINSTLASSVCFTDCQAELCNNKKVENLTVTVDSTNSLINVNWLSEIGMEYKLRLYTYNTNTWSSYSTVSHPQYSLALPYTDTIACGNRYKIEIVPICSGINGFVQSIVFNTNVAATYPGLTFQSTTQNQDLCLGYIYTFSVQSLYPGSNPIYQWKINGINVGSNSPNFTTSLLQNNDQLSCQMTSNDPCIVNPTTSVLKTVRVSSAFPCTLSNTEIDLESFSYFPNPVKNIFTIKSKNEIKNISIFNVLGQRLFQKNVSATESILDLSDFPRSTYLVKIKFDGFDKTIKIVRE